MGLGKEWRWAAAEGTGASQEGTFSSWVPDLALYLETHQECVVVTPLRTASLPHSQCFLLIGRVGTLHLKYTAAG